MEAVLLCTAIVGTAVVLGFAVGFIRTRWFRFIALGAAFVCPLLLVVGIGLSDGCAVKQGGQECLGYGFGLMMALGTLPAWIVLVLAGTWLTHRFQARA